MKKKFAAWLLTLTLLLGVLPALPASAKDADLRQKAARMVELINKERKNAGLTPVTADNSLLEQAADVRAEELPRLFSHTRPDGRGPFTALDDLGLSYRRAGENIAYNSGYADTVAQTMSDWMNSPGHRANILNGEFEQVGIGLFQSGRTYYWVQIFYTGSNPQPKPEPSPEPSPGPQPYPGTPFTDIDGHWGRESIRWAYERGLFGGVSAATFSPDTLLERGMLAEVLYRLAGKPASSAASGFTDVSPDAYYAKAVAWAARRNIVTGVGGGRFEPSSPITREQLAAMLYRYANLQGPVQGSLSAFSVGEAVSPWAQDAVQWAVNRGILTGKGSRLDPQGRATRAEAAAMLQRFAG